MKQKALKLMVYPETQVDDLSNEAIRLEHKAIHELLNDPSKLRAVSRVWALSRHEEHVRSFHNRGWQHWTPILSGDKDEIKAKMVHYIYKKTFDTWELTESQLAKRSFKELSDMLGGI